MLEQNEEKVKLHPKSLQPTHDHPLSNEKRRDLTFQGLKNLILKGIQELKRC